MDNLRGHIFEGLVEKESRNKKIFELWLACYTQEEIAKEVDLTQQAIDLVLQEMAELPKVSTVSADHLTDFQLPIYNVWIFSSILSECNYVILITIYCDAFPKRRGMTVIVFS